MASMLILRNAGGFERWRRAVVDKSIQLLTDNLLETEDENAPDPSLELVRPIIPNENASTKDIALWEARERQFVMIHDRTQQLLDFMVQLIEPTLYERVITTYYLQKSSPTSLYRAVKKTLSPSSKSAETDLQNRIENIEQSSKTTNIDVWLNSWIQAENIAKSCKYSSANDIIDRFHASLGRR